MTRKKGKHFGQTKDTTFSWIVKFDPCLEQWRSLAEEYLTTRRRAKDLYIISLGKLLYEYIYLKGLCTSPTEFLRADYKAYTTFDECLTGLKKGIEYYNAASNFLDWLLDNYFSVENDIGLKIVPTEYHNPLKRNTPNLIKKGRRLDESDKTPLPYHYIKQLRTILCPKDATAFNDWSWAKDAFSNSRKGGDWFVVNYSLINHNDLDCVWRSRKTSKYEQDAKGFGSTVYEIWSPVRAVALYIKLLLPLRTYQIRMLDSGEADTDRYEQQIRQTSGEWSVGNKLQKEDPAAHPVNCGVFRKFVDPITKLSMTGLYINTNKTADIDKEEWAKGYEVPWQNEEALYWLSKLRDWQEKYNPINNPTKWEDLDAKHLGKIKDKSILKQMGSSCFLFRDPTGSSCDKAKPLPEEILSSLWHKLLLELQNQCNPLEEQKDIPTHSFVKNGQTTFYPLHSLRVSLITAYALEGGVPMPILSKCIAGHARLLMTLYYTKAGITYVSEKMDEAEKKMAEKDQESFLRWVKEATYKQLEVYSASNDPISLQAVLNAQQSGASFIKDDKGICPYGCMKCDTGGVYTNDDTGKISFGVVPGYPEQNCVRCRWFLTGPAFLPGLVHHFNVIGYNIGEIAERLIRFENEIEQLENLKLECEQNGLLFLENEKLLKIDKLYQQEVQNNDKLANDYNATLRLIDRCITISREAPEDKNLQLVAVGTLEDVRLSLEDVPNKLYQIQTVCNGAIIFPETDASKAVLQRSQILDLTLAMNNRKPVFFSLTPEQQLIAGNAWMQLLINRTGSLKEAVPYIEGRKILTELGLDKEMEDLIGNPTQKLYINAIRENITIKMLNNNNTEVPSDEQHSPR